MEQRTKPKLKAVKTPPIDIHALNQADIAKRDWPKVHRESEKAKAIDLPATRRWKWSPLS